MATLAIFKDGRNLTSDELKEFLITKEESDVNRRCYEFLLGWLDQNPRRFDPVEQNNGEFWGVIDGDIAYINKTVFEETLKKNGFSIKPFLNWARMHNLLEYEDHGEGSERRLTVRKTLPNGRARCVALFINGAEQPINSPRRVTEEEEYRVAVNEMPDEMPF